MRHVAWSFEAANFFLGFSASRLFWRGSERGDHNLNIKTGRSERAVDCPADPERPVVSAIRLEIGERERGRAPPSFGAKNPESSEAGLIGSLTAYDQYGAVEGENFPLPPLRTKAASPAAWEAPLKTIVGRNSTIMSAKSRRCVCQRPIWAAEPSSAKWAYKGQYGSRWTFRLR